MTDNTPRILLGAKGIRDLPMTMNASHIRENILTEDEAKGNGFRVGEGINYHGLGETLFFKVIEVNKEVTKGNLVRVKIQKGSTQASEGASPIEADYSMDASNDSITQPEDPVNSKFSISEENSSDIRYSIDETPEPPDVSENATDTNDGRTEEELTDRDMLLAMAERLVGNEKENEILTRYKEQHEAQLRREDKPDSIYDEEDEQRGILFTDPDAAKRSAAFTTNLLRRRTIGRIFCEKVKKIFPFSENNIPKPIDKSAAMVYNDANEMHGGFQKGNDR